MYDLDTIVGSRVGSLRTSTNGIYRFIVGASPTEVQAAINNVGYMRNKLTAQQPSQRHAAPVRAEVHEPNYHPVAIDKFLAEMEEQQRKDVQDIYEREKELEKKYTNYFSEN